MIISSARFLISSKDYKGCPKPDKPEYAFIGRSNVGKSSLINLITNNKKLAKTSATPGKTRLINHFNINNEWYLVDLPGLGYAKLAKKEQESWQKMIYDYLNKRTNLLNTFLLIDSRHPLLDNDKEIINWFGKNSLPFIIILTKADKLSRGELAKNINIWKNYLNDYWEELPQIIVTSSEKGTGREEILNFIEETNSIFDKSKIVNRKS